MECKVLEAGENELSNELKYSIVDILYTVKDVKTKEIYLVIALADGRDILVPAGGLNSVMVMNSDDMELV